MDGQFWIYIIIAVIYILSRLLKKPEPGSGESPDTQTAERRRPLSPGQTGTEIPRQLTFEELLREITEGKQAREPETPAEYTPTYESYETDPGEEARSLEKVDFNEAEAATAWKPYEQIPPGTFERRSLEETLRLEDTVMDFGKFQAFEKRTDKKLLEDYIKIIRNPVALKQAVVMSEILKRKF